MLARGNTPFENQPFRPPADGAPKSFYAGLGRPRSVNIFIAQDNRPRPSCQSARARKVLLNSISDVATMWPLLLCLSVQNQVHNIVRSDADRNNLDASGTTEPHGVDARRVAIASACICLYAALLLWLYHILGADGFNPMRWGILFCFAQRYPQVDIHWPTEVRAHHAHDAIGGLVELDRAAHHAGVFAKDPLPCGEGKHHFAIGVSAGLPRLGIRGSQSRTRAEDIEPLYVTLARLTSRGFRRQCS